MSDDRDFIGYGADPPDPQWPGGARIAVNINLNFEGGGERSIPEGDAESEGALNDIGQRGMLYLTQLAARKHPLEPQPVAIP